MDELMNGPYRNMFTINLKKANEVEEWGLKWAVTAEQMKEAQIKANTNSVAGTYEALTQLGYTDLVL
jgi:hypothetical protein